MAERRESYNPLLKSYPDSEKVNAVSEGAEVLYVRLLAQSDDAGRYYGEPRWILARLFTARMIAGQVTEKDIEKRLAELEKVGLALRYRAADGTYLELPRVFKKLRTDVKPHLVFPDPLTENVPDTERGRNGFVPLDPTQPNPATDPTQTQPTMSASAEGDAGQDEEAEFIAAWNAADGNIKIRSMNAKRRKALHARMREPVWREQWRQALEKFPLRCFANSPDSWKPEPDWFLRPEIVGVILEGKYDWSKTNGRPAESGGRAQRCKE